MGFFAYLLYLPCFHAFKAYKGPKERWCIS
nr:MAG TPA: hypothetical protein [Caudoviricetes sp.]